MLKLTLKQFVEAGRSGALLRFLECPKPAAVAFRNRKMPAACDEIAKSFNASQEALRKRFPDVPEFERELDMVLAEPIELPGEPVKLADLADGKFLERDLDMLETFVVPK